MTPGTAVQKYRQYSLLLSPAARSTCTRTASFCNKYFTCSQALKSLQLSAPRTGLTWAELLMTRHKNQNTVLKTAEVTNTAVIKDKGDPRTQDTLLQMYT